MVEEGLEEHDCEDSEECMGERFEWEGGRHVGFWWLSVEEREGYLSPAQGCDEVV